MNTMKWLIKREFWEHKGGFLWAPVITGGVFIVLCLMAMIAAEVLGRESGIRLNNIDFGALTQAMSPSEIAEMGAALDFSLIMAATWPHIAMIFVVFFYSLGALYDERRDRSVLFWKSLPISDRDTVLSKLTSAVVVAPLIAAVAGILTSLGFFILVSGFIVLHGGNPFTMLWGPASPLYIYFLILASIPVYAGWALPTVGWLMLVSAWARTKPFLWAVLMPIFSGILVWWFDIMQVFNLSAEWFWQHVVSRLLLGTVPGMDMLYRMDLEGMDVDGPQDLVELTSLSSTYEAFLMPGMWLGILAGAGMIYLAIRMRRFREDAS